MSEAALLEVKFQEYIAKSSQLTGEFKTEAVNKIKNLENQLVLQQKECELLNKKRVDMIIQIQTTSNSIESLLKENDEMKNDLRKSEEKANGLKAELTLKLKENEEMKNDLRQSEEKANGLNAELTLKEIQINDLVKENEKLLKAKDCFNDRLKMFIHDISVSEVDLDTTTDNDKLPDPVNNNKRANDMQFPLISDENSVPKRQRIDAQQETSSDSMDELIESKNQNWGEESDERIMIASVFSLNTSKIDYFCEEST